MSGIPCQCSICFCVYDFTEFRFMQCGHGLCVECTEGFKASRCSSCRAERGTHVPHAVYIDQVEDTPAAEAQRLTRDLTSLREDTSTENYRNLAKRIRDPQHQSGLGVEDKERLFEAAKVLEKQIFPQMRKKEEYKARAQTLQAENDYLTTEVDSLRKQLKELGVDRNRIQRLEQQKATLLQKYQDERRGKLNWRQEYHELQETFSRERESMKEEWTREEARLQQKLDDQTKKTNLAAKKAKALGKENKKLRQQLGELQSQARTDEQDPGDDSLVVV